MLCDLTIQRHTVAITYDLSETPAKKGAPPIPQKRSKSFELCMNSKRRTISHRKARTTNRKEGEKETAEGTTKTKQKQEQN
ncbi:uncharacterized protein Dmoj_GI25665, isoform B [Drosophila mojavensis]|uniref:Uncharacterized protein, isoform B n=1 Tax=Drosophila mojavensis TaxID=7230 RepID=A0A0Q9XP50_DROMO|nr:uncharacterized protein Dmoj_GI25665, isoform B [Drosophila mojavensis]